jgi:hypothetical protein
MRLKLIDKKYNGIVPTCKCGCGQIPKYYDHERGYVEYVRGHHSRVKNNWGHNKEALEKSQDIRRVQIIKGKWQPWNKGKNAESDSRVEANNRAISQSILSNPNERQARAERLREGRLDRTIQSLTGKDHPQWKGGTSALQPLVRSHLHSIWTYPKLKGSGFKCAMCSASGPGLEVHHDGERFASILHKAIEMLGEPGEDFEKKSLIAEWVADYHVKNNVSGLVLCEGCHEHVHIV